MAALKSIALVVGLSVIALSQATVPQIYVSAALAGDATRTPMFVVISPPLTLTRKNGLLYLGIDPAALGVTIQLDGKTIGTTRILNIVSGPGIMPIAIQAPDGKLTMQISLAGNCVPDTAIPPNWLCSGPSAVPVIHPASGQP